MKTTVQKHSGFDKHQKPFRKTTQLYRKTKTTAEQIVFTRRYARETRASIGFGRKTTALEWLGGRCFPASLPYRSIPAAAV
jgi:hypothetical protein